MVYFTFQDLMIFGMYECDILNIEKDNRPQRWVAS